MMKSTVVKKAEEAEEEAPYDEVQPNNSVVRKLENKRSLFSTHAAMEALQTSQEIDITEPKLPIKSKAVSLGRSACVNRNAPWNQDSKQSTPSNTAAASALVPWMCTDWKGMEPWCRHPWEKEAANSMATTRELCFSRTEDWVSAMFPCESFNSPSALAPDNCNSPAQGAVPTDNPYNGNNTGSKPSSILASQCNCPVPVSSRLLQPAVVPLGPPYLQVYHVVVPPWALPVLPRLILTAETHARMLPQGWKTNLYSLTQQDIRLSDFTTADHYQPMTDFVLGQVIPTLYGGRAAVLADSNQPHILKYDEHHRSVPLHHDLCDVTVNISLNDAYLGGGTYIPALGHVPIRLPQGHMLVHPGKLLHAGSAIQGGTRYLLIYFLKFV